ncbi:MAG: IS200/IS605 family transposase [Anaerolineales bacterium]|nr:IS200/IS605 family transposase [Anaerolineales bacterium]
MPYCKLYYHLVWGIKNREPYITSEIEPMLFNFIRSKTIGMGGIVYALNGIEDHIHLVAHIPRTAPVSQFIGKIKGYSSTRLNKTVIGVGHFYWQAEYSAFTISEMIVPKIIRYVEMQKYHHK